MNYSRRAFLGLTAAGVAGCASAKVGGDDAVAALDENLSIIFSDAHVCGENARAANFTPKRLKAFVDEVLAMRPLPRRVIHLGDLAYLHGHPDDYAVSKPMLKRLSRLRIVKSLGTRLPTQARAYFAQATSISV